MQPLLRFWAIGLALAVATDGLKKKLEDCPPAVQKTFHAEAPGVKVDSVEVRKDEEGETTYSADLTMGGKPYSLSVLEDGTLSELNLEIEGDEDVPFDKLPPAVQKTFQAEGFGENVEGAAKDLKYGVTIYEASVVHKDKTYDIVVAEDGTLVEKVLVIEDEGVELSKCPAPVQATFAKAAKNGAVHGVTRYSGIHGATFEAEVELKGKIYLIEVAESGLLLSKSLEAGEE